MQVTRHCAVTYRIYPDKAVFRQIEVDVFGT